MGIGPLELSGAISRVQDFAIIKQNEDNKGAINQANIVQTVQRESDDKSAAVTMQGSVSNDGERHDAKEEGKNKYFGDGGAGKKTNTPKEGRVMVKGSSSGFDIRI